MQKACNGPVATPTAVGGLLQGFRSRVIYVFMPKNDPLPFRVYWSTNVNRQILLLCPRMFKQGPDYVISHVGWIPAMVEYVIRLMDMPRFLLQSNTFVRLICTRELRHFVVKFFGRAELF